MNQDSELTIETRAKSKTLKAQIRSQLISLKIEKPIYF